MTRFECGDAFGHATAIGTLDSAAAADSGRGMQTDAGQRRNRTEATKQGWETVRIERERKHCRRCCR